MYWQAKDPAKPKGRTRYFQTFNDPKTGRQKTVSVTLDKLSPAAKREAQALLDEKIRRIMSEAGKPQALTLGELVKKYSAYQRASFKESTCIQNEMHLVKITRALGEHTPASTLTAGRIVEALNASGQSATWKNEKLRHVKQLIRWAYSQEYVESNDFIERIPRWPEPSARAKAAEKYLESAELAALLDAMKHERWRLLTQFLALSGLRIGEAMALDLADLDMEARVIRVTKTYAINARTVTSTKTESSAREVYMRRELLAVCFQVHATAIEQARRRSYSPVFAFSNDDGGRISYEAYAKYFRTVAEAVIGRRLSVHSLRHTFTSLMAEAGVPLDVISRQLGHHDSKITKDIYMHITRRMAEQDAKKLESVELMRPSEK